jgi:hypothetical protein
MGWTAFDDVRNITFFPIQIDDGQHIVQQLSGRSYKRLAFQILLLAGPSPTKRISALGLPTPNTTL